MAKDRFLIAPFKDGMRSDKKPWMLPEDSFVRLENAYVYEGRVIKRFGSSYTGTGAAAGYESLRSRLAVPLKGGAGIGITDGAGAAAAALPNKVPGAVFKVGQLFSIGDEFFTVYQDGQMLRTGPNVNACHYDTTTGEYDFTNAAATTQIYFYPAEPVMGFHNYETGTIHNRPVLAADTQFIYQYNGTGWYAIGPLDGGGAFDAFTGRNDDFFRMANWMGTQFYNTYLFVTNYVAADGMWQWSGAAWTTFVPQFRVNANAALSVVNTARIILPFKDRLILLNTIETDAAGNPHTYQNRCRFSRNGTPDTTHPSEAWLEKDEPGYEGAGWVEAPTEEEILSAEFINDRLIVFFERSTWELAYTGSHALPFVWQKLNTELGSESPGSTVPFDKVILTVGTRGIHACNGSNVARIDDQIPDEVFNIRNDNEGPFRVAGIREYIKELVYWAVPYSPGQDANSDVFPNKVIVYNYKDSTWSLNDDSITAFGYIEQKVGPTWATFTQTWQESLFDWGEGVIAPQPISIIAGNQQGFVFNIEDERARNESVLQISNIAIALPWLTLTVTDHNLKAGEFIKVEVCSGSVIINDLIYQVIVVDANTIRIPTMAAAVNAYLGGGTIARVSRIDIYTKQFNPYISEGTNVSLEKIEFAVERTVDGQMDIQYFTSSSNFNLTGADPFVLECFPYDDYYPLETEQNILWHPVYFEASGEFVQLRLFYSNTAMFTEAIVESGFTLEGMTLYTSPTGRLQ